MKKSNLGQTLSNVLQVRVNSDQLSYLEEISSILGVSVSDYVRMMVNSNMISFRNQQKKGGASNENIENNSDN